jgi:DNA mismatch repair protein MutS
LLALFEGEQIVSALDGPQGKRGQSGKQASVDQLTLFGAATHPVVDELKKLDPEKVTPLEALTLLDRLVSRARQG